MTRARPRTPAGAVGGAIGFVACYRVSADQQSRSGFGLKAQKEVVSRYIATLAGSRLVAEFQEVESGRRIDPPQFAVAPASRRARRAIVVIAKLDRLACNARFALSVKAAASKLEADLISQRIKVAPAAVKARGKQLGGLARRHRRRCCG